jgi:hypothetical protein
MRRSERVMGYVKGILSGLAAIFIGDLRFFGQSSGEQGRLGRLFFQPYLFTIARHQ